MQPPGSLCRPKASHLNDYPKPNSVLNLKNQVLTLKQPFEDARTCPKCPRFACEMHILVLILLYAHEQRGTRSYFPREKYFITLIYQHL